MQIGRADKERIGRDRGGILAGGRLPVGQRGSGAALEPDVLREVVVVIDVREDCRAGAGSVVDGVRVPIVWKLAKMLLRISRPLAVLTAFAILIAAETLTRLGWLVVRLTELW